MDRRVARRGIISALVAVSLGLAGCSTADSATKSAGANTQSISAGAGNSPGNQSAHSSAGSSGGSGKASAAASAAGRRPTTGDPRSAMPRISPPTLTAVGYGPASSADTSVFAPALRHSRGPLAAPAGGLLASPAVRTLRVGGQDVGGVAVYSTKKGVAATPRFQDQYVEQLVNAVARTSSTPRFVRVGDQVIALSRGHSAVAGWFDGNRVVLVYRQSGTPDLAALAAGVRTAPPSIR